MKMEPRRGRSKLLNRFNDFFIPLMGLLGLSLCLQVVGFTTPGWFIVRTDHNYDLLEMDVGLWYVTLCENNNCTTSATGKEDLFGAISVEFSSYRAETTTALVLIGIAIAIGGFSRMYGQTQISAFCVIVLAFVSGSLALLASIMAAQLNIQIESLAQHRSQHEPVEFSSDEKPLRFPYSVLFTGLGGAFACLTSFFALVCVRPCIGETNNYRELQEWQDDMGHTSSRPCAISHSSTVLTPTNPITRNKVREEYT